MSLIRKDAQCIKIDEKLKVRREKKWDFIKKIDQENKEKRDNQNLNNLKKRKYSELLSEINFLKQQNWNLKRKLDEEEAEKTIIVHEKDKIIENSFSDNSKLKANNEELKTKIDSLQRNFRKCKKKGILPNESERLFLSYFCRKGNNRIRHKQHRHIEIQFDE